LNPAVSPPLILGHEQIARLIPHQGAMSLLARVECWDEQGIVCHANNHRDAQHTLRTASGLLSSCLIEYAAQAMALHGALCGGPTAAASRPGLLAAARQVTLNCLHLDQLARLPEDELRIAATRQAGATNPLLYSFSVQHGARQIASGRISVVLPPPGPCT
jgi:predicted hotdog family 3-hydroxylacyl-ACP dehydratase